MSETDQATGDGGCQNCDEVGGGEMDVVYDRNYDYPWKSGNPYSRVCPECGLQTFTSQDYWRTANKRYVIEKGEEVEDRKPANFCPHDDCEGVLVGQPDECPECEGRVGYEDGRAVTIYGCPYPDCDGELVGMPESCPECDNDIEWED